MQHSEKAHYWLILILILFLTVLNLGTYSNLRTNPSHVERQVLSSREMNQLQYKSLETIMLSVTDNLADLRVELDELKHKCDEIEATVPDLVD